MVVVGMKQFTEYEEYSIVAQDAVLSTQASEVDPLPGPGGTGHGSWRDGTENSSEPALRLPNGDVCSTVAIGAKPDMTRKARMRCL
jgi:hypothetical protein